MSDPVTFALRSEVSSNISRLDELFESKILYDVDNMLHTSAFIEVLIIMKDLLIKSEKHFGYRINFTDDIKTDEKLKIHDVHDLISNFRDAACHSDSFRRLVPNGVVAFNFLTGKNSGITIDNIELKCEYSDDIGATMGTHTLYINRHIMRAFCEVRDVLVAKCISQ